jgi:hypothetical protein
LEFCDFRKRSSSIVPYLLLLLEVVEEEVDLLREKDPVHDLHQEKQVLLSDQQAKAHHPTNADHLVDHGRKYNLQNLNLNPKKKK